MALLSDENPLVWGSEEFLFFPWGTLRPCDDRNPPKPMLPLLLKQLVFDPCIFQPTSLWRFTYGFFFGWAVSVFKKTCHSAGLFADSAPADWAKVSEAHN
jgi:hypothetical protein